MLAAVLAAPAAARPTAVVAFLDDARALDILAGRPELAIGYLNATQGAYSRGQALLDMSAGNRVSSSGYDPRPVPPYAVVGGRVAGWGAVVARARSAPTDIVPGLLGSLTRAAWSGPRGRLEAVVAADRTGRVARAPLAGLGARSRLAVTVLHGGAALDRLLRERPRDRLVLVIAPPPAAGGPEELPIGAAGLGHGLLTSRTTRFRGLVAGTDVAATVLAWLGIPAPATVHGEPMTASGPRDVAGLRATEARLQAVYPRRLPVGLAVLAAMAATGLALVLAGHPRAAARVAALVVLWVPALALLAAALAPSRTGEIALVAGGAVVLAALTDRVAGWPRGAAVPALAGVVAYVADLAFGSSLIVRSLLGPNPRFGSRFYGIGNELESVLPVLLLIGMAALAGRRPRSRGLAAAFGAAMLALGVLVGAGRLGADVGGVVSIAAAGAVAVLLLLPGGVSRRAVAAAVAAPVAAVLLLAGIDLATGGDAHFSRTILGAGSAGDVLETLGRRYDLAWHALTRGLMPLATLVALGLGALAMRRRRTLYAGVRDAPAWTAALAGGLTGAVAGALANDSGPVLLVIGVALLADATLYLRGGPPTRGASGRRPASRARGQDARRAGH